MKAKQTLRTGQQYKWKKKDATGQLSVSFEQCPYDSADVWTLHLLKIPGLAANLLSLTVTSCKHIFQLTTVAAFFRTACKYSAITDRQLVVNEHCDGKACVRNTVITLQCGWNDLEQ